MINEYQILTEGLFILGIMLFIIGLGITDLLKSNRKSNN